ncbi:Glutathione S-transferase S1 [Podila verticillata]|nr:Glutathione S-transferase S1 [Podila verticillata]
MVHAFFNPAQAATFNEIALRKDSTFEVCYFGFHGLAHTVRTILALSGAKFTSYVPEDWASEKPKKPFGVMPTLKETSVNGKVIEIAETDAIARYLSRKFGYMGTNAFEETVINQFFSSTNSVASTIFIKYFGTKDPEAKAEVKSKLLTDTIQPWMRFHEQHLADNGSNGHYIGSALSLADIATAVLINMLNGLFGADTVTEEKNPALFKVHATVVSNPSFVAWTHTDSFKTLAAANLKVVGF